MNILRPIIDQIEHQKSMLLDADRKYTAAVMAGNYPAAQEQAKRYNRIRTALVLHGVVESFREIDREAVEARRDE